MRAAGYKRWQESPTGQKSPRPLRLYSAATVLPQWVDYNGHMSESFYLYAFGGRHRRAVPLHRHR